MTTIKTKQELEKWIKEVNNDGYSVPSVLNGGGFSWINDWEEGKLDDYFDEIQVLQHGEEFPDFKFFLSDEEYNEMTFVRVAHKTGYNEENFDYQFGIYE